VKRKNVKISICDITDEPVVLMSILILLCSLLTFKRYKQSWERRLYQANHDDLTGLAMRRLFKPELFKRLEAIRKRGCGSLAVFYIDVDRFKLVNDIQGHNVGDLVLKSVADVLHCHIRQCDFAVRVGGDEFIVLLENIQDGDIDVYAEKLIGLIQNAMKQVCSDIDVGISLGISSYPFDTEDPIELVNFADKALLQLKVLKKRQTVEKDFFFYYELDNGGNTKV